LPKGKERLPLSKSMMVPELIFDVPDLEVTMLPLVSGVPLVVALRVIMRFSVR
jgi:hypothetical protein